MGGGGVPAHLSSRADGKEGPRVASLSSSHKPMFYESRPSEENPPTKMKVGQLSTGAKVGSKI